MFHFPFKRSTLCCTILLVILVRLGFATHFAMEKWTFTLWVLEFKSEAETSRKKSYYIFSDW